MSDSKFRINERILSAEIRVMTKTTGAQPPLPWYTRLVMFDLPSRRPIHSVPFQGGKARWFAFPVSRSLVDRWISSKRLIRRIHFKLLSHNPDTNMSFKVTEDSDEARNKRPLLIVKTLPIKAKLFEDITSLIR